MADSSARISSLSSFSIKCSMCAQDIDISMMGDHVCAIKQEPTPPPETNRSFKNNSSGLESNKAPGLLKPRVPLARVDTAAANRLFTTKDQLKVLTPASASSSYATLSPLPSTGRKTPNHSQPLGSPADSLPLDYSQSTADLGREREKTKQTREQNGYNFGRHEESEKHAPASPRIGTGGGLLKQMKTMASGPFDVVARGGFQRTVSDGSIDINTDLDGRKRTSQNPTANGQRLASHGPKSPRIEKPGGYGGFGPLRSRNDERLSPSRLEVRSQTIPRESEAHWERNETRSPTEPSPHGQVSNARSPVSPPKRPRRPSVTGPDLSRPLPPRGTRLIGSRDERRLTEAPPVPGVDLASEFGASNPYHTASESQSSTASEFRRVSNNSSRSSPPSSPRGFCRNPSNTSNIDLTTELELSVAELRPRELPSISKPLQLEIRPKVQNAPNISPREPSPGPRDPAIQQGRQSPAVSRPVSPLPPLHRSAPSEDIRRPATAKGNCKGCGLAIKGKSVSSADGRLTGRYHKSCFVCNTCREAFATASFYVLGDAPYCERHYHKLNNSMCTSCDRGIEGQYLETERKQKFHAHCFSCADCKRILKQDYFEMNGRFYCERDAFRRAQQRTFLGSGGATNRMERRTTRMMMMMA